MNAPAPKIGLVSLGCPKALVDTERLVTRMRAEGYEVAPDYAGADVVLVNTCGFLDSAKEESLAAIGEAMAENGRVIVTGCLGVEKDMIMERHEGVLAITGPHQYEEVMEAVHKHVPPVDNPHAALIPPEGIHLTPRHYAYVKISEGCNNTCTFCIIPSIRGKLASRPAADVVREAERLAKAGVKELLIVSQDTSAYGLDLKYEMSDLRGREIRTHIQDLAEALGDLGVWVRMHYIYPYPHVDNLIPLMAQGKILPYLDIPFQHAHPDVLRAMKRPANQEKVLTRIKKWRDICPDLTIRSTFIVGFPGETEEQFQYLLDWLEEAELDRVGCFRYEPVTGAVSNDMADLVPEEIVEERWNRLMATQQRISKRRLARKVGHIIEVLIDEVDGEGAIARSAADAPEIDGCVFLNGVEGFEPGDMIRVKVTNSDEYDLWAEPVPAED